MLADNGVRLYVSDTNTGNIDKFIAANPGKDIKAADVSEALYLDVDIMISVRGGRHYNRG